MSCRTAARVTSEKKTWDVLDIRHHNRRLFRSRAYTRAGTYKKSKDSSFKA